MEDKLCLKWNDFQENISTSFGKLRQDSHFSDVTLVCEDGEQIESNKVILAAFSPFFAKLLERNDHPHPLIYMRGVEKVDLGAVMDFLYCGEANILQRNLESFLAIAQDLKVKGLQQDSKETGNLEEKETEMATNFAKSSQKTPSKRKEKRGKKISSVKVIKKETFLTAKEEVDPVTKKEKVDVPMVEQDTITTAAKFDEAIMEEYDEDSFFEDELTEEKVATPLKNKNKQLVETPATNNQVIKTHIGNKSMDDIKCEPVQDLSNLDQLQKHKETVNSMLEKSENHISNESYNLRAYYCKVCGKEGVKTNIKKHIEAHHMENIILGCPLCDKNCSSMTALGYHKKTSHTIAHGDLKITDQTINNKI